MTLVWVLRDLLGVGVAWWEVRILTVSSLPQAIPALLAPFSQDQLQRIKGIEVRVFYKIIKMVATI